MPRGRCSAPSARVEPRAPQFWTAHPVPWSQGLPSRIEFRDTFERAFSAGGGSCFVGWCDHGTLWLELSTCVGPTGRDGRAQAEVGGAPEQRSLAVRLRLGVENGCAGQPTRASWKNGGVLLALQGNSC